MPKVPKGQKRPADVIGNAVKVMRIATGEEDESLTDDGKDKAAVELGRKGGDHRQAGPEAYQHVVGERSNLTMRMHNRRFTRLTNAFSKKFESHVHMVALYTVFYNWTRIHKTLRVTPAMAAGLTDRVWDMKDIVGLMDAVAPKPGRPKTYKTRAESGMLT
jgi:hypothetical protein